ncbi:MAG: SDR family NAD(P)-dependent oxidoreductase [Planctomycetales bacterium]|nr:SDR family NAD(P)-dependent oxidoreductase [Planctomycetales bacterium]
MDLNGKIAIVTGGATGIGFGIARALVEAGCRVAIGSRNAAAVERAVHDLSAVGSCDGRTLDVSNRDSVGEFFAWVRSELGESDILVNNAGMNVRDRRLDALSADDWQQMLQTNATGAFYCLQQVLPAMRARRDGLVVNIVSTAGRRAGPLGGPGYSASKFAMAALGIAAALEVKDEGVRVSNIYPGEVNTPILDRRPVPVSDEHREQILQPEDVAAAVLMIARLPARAHVPELVIKPTTQPHD